MYFKRRSLGTLCGIITTAYIGSFLSPAESLALSLQESLTRAETSNPGLQAMREQIFAAEERVSGSTALPDPKLQLTYFGESVETRTGPQEAIYSISQTVPWPRKLSTRKAFAVSQADVAQLRYLHRLSQLKRDVAQTYVELAYLDKAVESTEANLRLIDDTVSIVEAQVQSGASINALLRFEVERERLRDELDRIGQQQVEAKARLAAMIFADLKELGESFDFPKLSAVPDEGSLMELLQNSNPELILLRQGITTLEEQVKLSRLDRYPDFTVGLNYIQVGNEGTAPDAGRDPWALTFAVNVPIWESKNRAAISESLANKRAHEQSIRERVLLLEAELRALVSKSADSERRAQRYEQSLIPLAQQALENSQSAYESSQVSVLELIDSERALLDLNLTYWRAVASALQADAAIHALVGSL
ncbi:MAG: TolC family protein [Cyanobacteria bacterium P01_A01_bin.17]